jgi:GPH family glycoside/pentoside/hexuronide:cation symporter
MSIPYTASNRAIYAWGTGQVGWMCIYTSFALLMPIYTTGLGMSPILVSWAVILPRFIDGFVDAVIAHWSDNSHSRWGRRKPFLLASTFAGALLTMAVWWVGRDWGQTAQFIYLFVTATLLYCALGVYQMAYGTLGYELTDDYHERSRVMAIKGLFGALAAMGTGWVYWLALRPFFGGEIAGIRWISVGLALIAMGCALTVVCNTQERFQKINREPVKLLSAMHATLTNRPFVILLLMQITQGLGGAVFGGLFFYVNVYYVCQGDKSLATQIAGILGTTGAMLGLVAFPFMKPISQRVGKRNGVILGAGMIAATAMLTPWFMTPKLPYLQVILFCGLAPVTGIAQTLTAAIFPDICDLDELETGHRREGLFAAVSGFIWKIETSLCGLLVGYLIAFSGFDPKLVVQTGETITRLRWFAFAPYIALSIAAMYFAWRFPITEKMMADVRRKLDVRRAAASELPPEQSPSSGIPGTEPEPEPVIPVLPPARGLL